jgi:hypothetical protein
MTSLAIFLRNDKLFYQNTERLACVDTRACSPQRSGWRDWIWARAGEGETGFGLLGGWIGCELNVEGDEGSRQR